MPGSSLEVAASGGAGEPSADAPKELKLDVPSDLGFREEAVELFARHCVEAGVPPESSRFKLKVALCEALQNAMIYGNKLDHAKMVRVEAVVEDGNVTISVADEGEGFDPEEMPDPTTPGKLQLPDGRGLFVIQQLADEVRFNDRGNCIWMVLRHS